MVAAAQAIANLKMMIPANPGGGWDQTGRTLGAAMQSAKSVQSVQFDNKGGAAGTIGLAQFVNASKGDPNAMLIGGMVMVGGIVLNKSPVDLNMVTPIARLTSEYEVVVVPANSPFKSMGDLVKAFKADPGKISWNGGSAGGTDHILAGLIARAVGADPTKVNYIASKGGGDQIANIVGGHVSAGVAGLGEFAEHIKSGRMRGLAVSGPCGDRRHPVVEGAGCRCRARQLARRLRCPGHHARAARHADRGDQGRGRVDGLEGDAEEDGLGVGVHFRRRLQDLPRRRHQADPRHPRFARAGQVSPCCRRRAAVVLN